MFETVGAPAATRERYVFGHRRSVVDRFAKPQWVPMAAGRLVRTVTTRARHRAEPRKEAAMTTVLLLVTVAVAIEWSHCRRPPRLRPIPALVPAQRHLREEAGR